MAKSTFFIFALAFGFSSFTSAQTIDPSEVKIDGMRPLRIIYKIPSWNTSKEEINTGLVLVRDGATRKSAKLEMRETGKNTGRFIGNFILNFGGKDQSGEQAAPEIYIISVKMAEDLKSIDQYIEEGALLRKPYFFRLGRRMQLLTLFETREEANAALERHLKSANSNKPVVDAAALEAERLAKAAAEKARLEQLAAEAEAQRQRLEAIERKRREEQIARERQLNEEQRRARIAQAKKIGEEGMVFYNKGDFANATKKFSKAVELDPTNTSYNFPFGVSLYRTDQTNRAVVLLEMAEGPKVNAQERDYFLGLSFMKLKDAEKARPKFVSAKEGANRDIGASSAFYVGVIDYQNEEFESARDQFQFVLDNSNDPRLDEQADVYMDQIANAMAFKKRRERRWSASANLGLMYDSNILNQADASNATGLKGWRGVYGGTLDYRAVYTPDNEFVPQLSLNDIYTTTTSFKPEAQYQNTDPLTLGFALPWKNKGTFFGSPGHVGLKAAYEGLQLNADGEGRRETISHSYIFKTDMTLVRSGSYFPSYSLEYRNDVSTLEVTNEASAQSANKISLGTVQTFFIDDKKSKAWIIDGTASNNAAKGADLRYTKLDVGAMYLFPAFFDDTTWTSRLGYANSSYPDSSVSRRDNTLSFTLGLSTPLTEAVGLVLNLGYTKNSSSVETFTYTKTTALTMLSWGGVL